MSYNFIEVSRHTVCNWREIKSLINPMQAQRVGSKELVLFYKCLSKNFCSANVGRFMQLFLDKRLEWGLELVLVLISHCSVAQGVKSPLL